MRKYCHPKQYSGPVVHFCGKFFPTAAIGLYHSSYNRVNQCFYHFTDPSVRNFSDSCYRWRRITRASSTSSQEEQSPRRLGIGLGQWTEYGANDFSYKSVIDGTLFRNNSITNTIEIGFLDNHDVSFCNAYRSIVDEQTQPPLGEAAPEELLELKLSSYLPPKINVLWRVGYRFEETNRNEANPKKESDDPEAPDTSLSFLNDGSTPNIDLRKKPFFRKHFQDVVQVDEEPPPTKVKMLQPPKLIHNISSEYIHHVLNPNGKHDLKYAIHPDIAIKQEPFIVPPLVQLKQDFPDYITLTVMLHNPELQLSRYYIAQRQSHPSISNIPTSQDFLESALYSAFQTLQQYCSCNVYGSIAESSSTLETTVANQFPPLIDGYGVISNGLSLPKEHPLHVSYLTILKAAKRVYQDDLSRQAEPKFNAIQLPANALETKGIHVAKQIQTLKQQEVCNNKNQPTYISNALVYAIRPLTCYSDGGTGSSGSGLSSKSHPFTLIDYKIELKKNRKTITQWTNMMEQPPPAYNTAYQRAMQLFDAQDILEKQAERRREIQQKRRREIQRENKENDFLTDEERETLHGCRLLQNMIQKLDSLLENARSMKTHEIVLETEVIPILRDQFESYDENTSSTLEAYFAAYSKAMQYHVAKNTRQLLRYGELDISDQDTSNTTASSTPEVAPPTYNALILPPDKRLQEFGIELLFNQTVGTSDDADDSASSSLPSIPVAPAFDVIMVGLANLEEVLDTIEIFKKIQKTGRQS